MEFSFLLNFLFLLLPVLSRCYADRSRTYQWVDYSEPEPKSSCNYSDSFMASKTMAVSDTERQQATERIRRIRDSYVNRNDQIFNSLLFDDAFFASLRNHQGAYFFLQQSKHLMGDDDCFKTAIYFSQEIKRYPDHAIFYANRGHAFMRMGMHKQALQDFSKAIELHGEEPLYYYYRGFAWLALGEQGMAFFDWLHASQMGNESARQMIL